MGWIDVIEELENKVKGTIQGTYHPLDNLPLFRVQYPPHEEREAISQFLQLKGRFEPEYPTKTIFLTDVFAETLSKMLNCDRQALTAKLVEYETGRKHSEIQHQIEEHLPKRIGNELKPSLESLPKNSVVILLRVGSLYPFMRSSALVAQIERYIHCVVVLPYPGESLGNLLDTPPADQRGQYYRGENIVWR